MNDSIYPPLHNAEFCNAADQSRPNVQTEFDILEKMQAQTAELVSNLESRLGPVLYPDSAATPTPNNGSDNACTVVGWLQNAQRRAGIINARLTEIIARLAV